MTRATEGGGDVDRGQAHAAARPEHQHPLAGLSVVRRVRVNRMVQ
jgi:hypothetical protein